MDICTTCRREVKVGQRVIQNYILFEPREFEGAEAKLTLPALQHANCYDADGPRYDDAGQVIVPTRRGYIPGDERSYVDTSPFTRPPKATRIDGQDVEHII